MRILDLNQFAQFRDQKDVKVLRHREPQRDLWLDRANSTFDDYQNRQSRDVFGSARFIVSFIAERYKYGKFVGVWEVLSKRPLRKGYAYDTRELSGFADLEQRLIVDWGKGTRSWAQWLHRSGNKEISEITPRNYVMDFPGFYDFTLSFEEMRRLVSNPESNREWYRMLSSVSGVYVLVDTITGNQYVGSAYGMGGIWGRWKSYARSCSGGNVLLKKLLQENPNRYKDFQFSVLRVFEPGITKDAVIAHEVRTKNKLGRKACSLNGN